MPNNAHVFALLPEYALGSLEENEARQVTDHLVECSVCREELAAYQKVADQLPLVVTEQTPSRELKSRLMERIHRLEEPRRSPVETRRTLPSRERRIPQRWVPVGAFAGLLVILLLAVSNLFMWQRLNRLEVLTGPLGMRAIVLQNTSAASDASAFVVMGADGKNGVLVVDHLPTLDEGLEYQVWLMKDGMRTSGGTFTVDEEGYRGLRLNAPDSLLTYSDVYVTVEPTGGSDAPTGAQVLMGSLFNR